MRTRPTASKSTPRRRTCTTPFDLADYLRTPEDLAAYWEAWVTEAPDDVEGLARAKAQIAQLERLLRAAEAEVRDAPKDNAGANERGNEL